MKHTSDGHPIWEADYIPGPDETIIDGELVQDLLPLSEDGRSVVISREELGKLLLESAVLAFNEAEKRRQSFATTPDGIRDKTIHQYKPVPYHQALQESSSLQDVPDTGQEHWQGDSINPIPQACATRLFLNYPNPLLLSERCKEK